MSNEYLPWRSTTHWFKLVGTGFVMGTAVGVGLTLGAVVGHWFQMWVAS